MVNEEDHMRIQTILPGFQLEEALRLASVTDDAVEETIDYAFDENLGYLCACPTNVGTGLRASVMVHLPALALVGMVGQVLGAVSKVGVAVRGAYGEGTEAIGNMFQVSNQVTMGRAEEEIVAHLKAVCGQLADSERNARKAIMSDARNQLEDRVWRSYGLLTNARIVSSDEAVRLISAVKLGSDLGIIPGLAPSCFHGVVCRYHARACPEVRGQGARCLGKRHVPCNPYQRAFGDEEGGALDVRIFYRESAKSALPVTRGSSQTRPQLCGHRAHSPGVDL